MSSSPSSSPILKRLSGALILALALLLGFWAGTTRGTRDRAWLPAGWSTPNAPGPRAGGGAAVDGQEGVETVGEPGLDHAAGTADPRTRRPYGEASDEAAVDQFERRMAAGMSRARESVVTLEYVATEAPSGSRRLATGVVLNAGGDVLSVRIDPPSSRPRAGVSGGLAEIVAGDVLGRRHAAKWLAIDPESGLTLLRITAGAVRPIQVATERPALGNQVIVVGNPFGLGHSVSRGHVAGLDRTLKLGSYQLAGLIQIQAPLYPGDSGAVVANLRGQLLGLIRGGLASPAASSHRTETGRDNGFGFAILACDALWVAEQLRDRGRVDRAYLGVRPEPDSGHEARAPSSEGALLHAILDNTPASRAGLRAGDSIIAIDGRPIRTSHDLTDQLERIPARATIRLEVVRGSGPRPQHLTIALETGSRPGTPPPRPPSNPAGSPAPKPGPTVVQTTAPAPATATTVPPPTFPLRGEPPKPTPEPSPAVAIPAPVRTPLHAPVPPPQAEDLGLTLPRAVTERFEKLERRIEKLERQPVPPTESRREGTAARP